MGARPLVLGLLCTLPASVFTGACLVGGRLFDRLGYRRLVLGSVLTSVILWSLMAPASQVWHLLGLVTVDGLAAALFYPPLLAWLGALTIANTRVLNRALSSFNLASCLGVMLGPLLIGHIWEGAGSSSFYVVAALGLVMMVLVAVTPSSPETSATGAESETPSEPRASAGEIRRFVIVTRLGNFGANFAIAIVRTMFPKLGITLRFSAAVIGNAIVGIYVAHLVLFWLAGRSSKWQYRSWVLWLGAPVGIVGMTLAAVARTPLAFTMAFAIAGVCSTVTWVTSLFYGMHSRPEARGASMATHEAIAVGGWAMGPLLGGLAATWFDLRASFVLAAVVLLLAGLGQLVAWRCLGEEQAAPHLPGGIKEN